MNGTKFGCVINDLPSRSGEQKDKYVCIAKAGFDTTDVGGQVRLDNCQWLSEAAARGEHIRSTGLDVVCYHSELLLPDAPPEINGAIQELHMQSARAQGCSMFLVHSKWVNYEPFDFSSSREWAEYMKFDIANLTELSRRCVRYGLRLVIENNPYFPLPYYTQLLEELPQSVAGIIFDIGHANLQVSGYEYPVSDFIHRLGKRIEHLHLHDNNGKEDRHIPILGQGGTIDWKECFRALKTTGYTGVLNEELPPMTPPDMIRWAIFERGCQPLRELWEDS